MYSSTMRFTDQILLFCILPFRFYEEGDAASMVIPRESDFRKNIDWLDNNFPREVSSSQQL